MKRKRSSRTRRARSQRSSLKLHPMHWVIITLSGFALGVAFLVGLISDKDSASAAPTGTTKCTIQRIIDGDTIKCQEFNQEVRFAAINTPENHNYVTYNGTYVKTECMGPEAAAYTKKRLPSNSVVKLEKDPVLGNMDDHNRYLRYVWIKNEDLNVTLVKKGYAAVIRYSKLDDIMPQTLHYAELKAAEDAARLAGVGIWKKGCGPGRNTGFVEGCNRSTNTCSFFPSPTTTM